MEISASFWLIKLFTTLKNISLQSCEVSPMQARSLPLTTYIQFLLTCLLTESSLTCLLTKLLTCLLTKSLLTCLLTKSLLTCLLTILHCPSYEPGEFAELVVGNLDGAISLWITPVGTIWQYFGKLLYCW